jgi:hypothetical protein
VDHRPVTPPPGTPPAPAPELLAGISRQAWLANRANNALQRPTFIGAISIGTFVIAIASLVMAPRMTSAPPPRVQLTPRPDTLTVVGDVALSRSRASELDSALGAARKQIADAAAARDTITPIDTVLRDSLTRRVAVIGELRTRAEQSPLLSSYRALASVPELQSDPRVTSLLDTLAEIEHERDGLGSVGGVDPVFVALTSKANQIGRHVTDIAGERMAKLRAQMSDSAYASAGPSVVTIDTMAFIVARDSALHAVDSASSALSTLRAQSRAMDARDRALREQENAVAPPVALLAAAVVLSAVIGFAFAFVGELRHPRVSDQNETERVLRARVLAMVAPAAAATERSRREADRAAPPYLDPHSEGHQLAYLGLSNTHPAQLGVTITGDDPAVAAVVACNLAAVAADEARNALIVDLTASASASAVLRTRVAPGVSDVARRGIDWADATIAARVGRNKTVDIIPRGSTHAVRDAAALVARDAVRFGRYYDAIFVLMDENTASDASGTNEESLAERTIVYCARRGVTRLAHIAAQLGALHEQGGFVAGIVLWSGPRPALPEFDSRESAAHPQPPQQLAVSNSV